MTYLQYSAVFTLAVGAWGAMCYTMRKMKPGIVSGLILAACVAAMLGAFYLGSQWNHVDFTCHPGQHCTPWGD
jgi:drug/metabolite transporter (DMT)-like permease